MSEQKSDLGSYKKTLSRNKKVMSHIFTKKMEGTERTCYLQLPIYSHYEKFRLIHN